MAEIIVKNSLDSDVVVKITVTMHEAAIRGDKDEGEPKWILMLGTTHLDMYGQVIPPVVIHNITETKIDTEIEKAINVICQKVDWGNLYADISPPVVINYGPTGDNVKLSSEIFIKIKEELPSSGLDLSNLKVTFSNDTFDYDITDEVRTNEKTFSCDIRWRPDQLVEGTYH